MNDVRGTEILARPFARATRGQQRAACAQASSVENRSSMPVTSIGAVQLVPSKRARQRVAAGQLGGVAGCALMT